MSKHAKRGLSGIVPVAVMTPSKNCPGECVYCPNETVQSYFDEDPVPSRAINVDFDAKKQVLNRIRVLKNQGNVCNKVELIIMGGTFGAHDWSFQKNFVKECIDAMNGCDSNSLKEAQDLNETAPIRCVDIGLETRPDHCDVNKLLELCVNSVELGVQSLNEEVLKTCRRGHGLEEVAEATRACRKAGMKLCYHMMLGLPGSTYESDLETFRLMFNDERFKPDMIKIYPTLVMPNSELEKLWRKGEYKPLSIEESVARIIEIKKKIIPKWVRIMRIQRDFQMKHVLAGPKRSDLRNLVWQRFDGCQCIRCREPRRQEKGNPKLRVQTYPSSGGTQYFISYTPPLIGFVRIHMGEHATISELRVYGPEAKLGSEGVWQHRGYGTKLLKIAEKITEDNGYDELRILSAIGTRKYYKDRGYEKKSYWMIKEFN